MVGLRYFYFQRHTGWWLESWIVNFFNDFAFLCYGDPVRYFSVLFGCRCFRMNSNGFLQVFGVFRMSSGLRGLLCAALRGSCAATGAPVYCVCATEILWGLLCAAFVLRKSCGDPVYCVCATGLLWLRLCYGAPLCCVCATGAPLCCVCATGLLWLRLCYEAPCAAFVQRGSSAFVLRVSCGGSCMLRGSSALRLCYGLLCCYGSPVVCATEINKMVVFLLFLFLCVYFERFLSFFFLDGGGGGGGSSSTGASSSSPSSAVRPMSARCS